MRSYRIAHGLPAPNLLTSPLLLHYVAVSIAHLVSMEMLGIDTPGLLRFVTDVRHRALIAMLRMEMIVYGPVKFFRSVEPGTRSDEDATSEPFRTVVAGWSTSIGWDVIVAIGAIGRHSNVDADLSLCSLGVCRQANPNHSS